VGRSTRPEEIDHAARLLAGAARRLRAGSGSWSSPACSLPYRAGA